MLAQLLGPARGGGGAASARAGAEQEGLAAQADQGCLRVRQHHRRPITGTYLI